MFSEIELDKGIFWKILEIVWGIVEDFNLIPIGSEIGKKIL